LNVTGSGSGGGTGGSGGEANHSPGAPTGYSDWGMYDLEDPEAGAAGAPGGTYHSIDHYNNLGNGSAPVTGLPVILDLHGDGVEGNEANGGERRCGWRHERTHEANSPLPPA